MTVQGSLVHPNENNYHLLQRMNFDAPKHESATAEAPASPSNSPRRVFSEQLIGPAREVLIRHAGCDYRLRITRQDKLILTK
jgi:hemin uptake protein HemP